MYTLLVMSNGVKVRRLEVLYKTREQAERWAVILKPFFGELKIVGA